MKLNLLTKYPTIEVLRILTNNELTVREIGKEITDISRSVLYRHIKKMYDQNLIVIAKENIINGLKQKVYTASGTNTLLKKKDINKVTKEDIELFFNRFIFSVISQFQKNVERNNFNVNFIRHTFYLTPEESKEVYKKLKNVLYEYSDNKPSEDRNAEEIVIVHQDVD